MKENLRPTSTPTMARSIRAKWSRRRFRCPSASACGSASIRSSQDDYLSIVAQWLKHFGCERSEIESARGRCARVGAGARVALGPRRVAVRPRLVGAQGMTDDRRAKRRARSREVAVGVMMQPDGRYLLAQRPEGKAVRGLLGISGRQDRGGRERRSGAAGANCTRNWVSTSPRANAGDARTRLSARATCGFTSAR